MLDLKAEVSVEWYNAAVAPDYALPTFARRRTRAVLLGNTRAMWPHFIAAWRADAGLRVAADPLDRFVERVVSERVAALGVASVVRFVHDAPPGRVAMQRLAHVSGLAPLSPSHLNVHPEFGPWIALRAVVVMDAEGPETAPRASLPCRDCDAACLPAFESARGLSAAATNAAVSANWRAWVAVRDACPVGRDHRYTEQQLRYHYTKDRSLLA